MDLQNIAYVAKSLLLIGRYAGANAKRCNARENVPTGVNTENRNVCYRKKEKKTFHRTTEATVVLETLHFYTK